LLICTTLVSCTTVKIPDVAIHKEIPFIDGAEGVSYTIRSEKTKLYTPAEWQQKRPQLVCVDYDGWYKIKKSWLEACRYAGKKCDMEVNTIEDTIRSLDELAEQVMKYQRKLL